MDTLKPEYRDGKLFLSGVVLRPDVVSQNGRVYPADVIRDAVERFKTCGLGVPFGGPDTQGGVPWHKASHEVRAVTVDESDGAMRVECEVLATPCGKIIRTLVESGLDVSGFGGVGFGSSDEHGVVTEFSMTSVTIGPVPSAIDYAEEPK